MYLHCHSCDWSQDDFYSESYNPADYLKDWNEYLFGEKKDELDKQFSTDSEFVRQNGAITAREVLARNYEDYANRIRKMKWVTHESFAKDRNAGIAKCPKCGSSDNFDID